MLNDFYFLFVFKRCLVVRNISRLYFFVSLGSQGGNVSDREREERAG